MSLNRGRNIVVRYLWAGVLETGGKARRYGTLWTVIKVVADVRPSAATPVARGPFTFIIFEASSLRFCLCIIAHFDLLHVICIGNLKYAYGTKECSGNYRQQQNVGMEFKLRTLYKHMLSIWFPQLNPPKARIGVWRDIYGRKRRAFGNDLQTGARSSILTVRVKFLLTV